MKHLIVLKSGESIEVSAEHYEVLRTHCLNGIEPGDVLEIESVDGSNHIISAKNIKMLTEKED